MQESYGEGLATHTGPESCVVVRKDGGEALTGERAGQPLSRENWMKLSGADAVEGVRKATPAVAITRAVAGPGAVEDPAHARKHFAREPGDPATVWEKNWCPDRIGKSKDVRR
jgi:hypothetical protein